MVVIIKLKVGVLFINNYKYITKKYKKNLILIL